MSESALKSPLERTPLQTLVYFLTWTYTELFIPLLAVLVVVALGVVGYSKIEGWSFLDSFYMTVITLSTTGFMEVHPLSPAGRIFTVCLIILGVGIVAMVFAVLTQKIVQRQFSIVFNKRKVMEAIHRISDHTIICGFGRLARIAAEELRQAGKPLIIVEKDEAHAQLAQQLDFLVIKGDATLDEVLVKAGLTRAKHIVSLLPKDSDNLYVILTSREMAPEIFILSRAEDEAGDKRLRRAGADRIMSPYRIGGLKIAEGLLRPYVTDFLDLAVSNKEHGLQIEEIRIPDNSPLDGKSLLDAALRPRTNVIVAAIISKSGEMEFNPAATTVIHAGSTFIALGKRVELSELEQIVIGG